MSKLQSTGISIFATMSQLCRDHGAINLAQGCPDFDCDPQLVELVYKYMKLGFNQYAPMEGIIGLREAISEKTQRLYHAFYNPQTDITITAGATEAIYTALTSVVEPGDEVILFEPAFDSYIPVIRLSGGVPVPIRLSYPDYRIDWNSVKEKVTSRTRVILINSPHNPTGAVLTKADLDALAEVSEGKNILIISDEVYEHIIFDEAEHVSVALHPELRQKSFIVASFGKTFHTTGWRMGYCIAPAPLSAAFRKVHQFVTFSASTPAQYAITDYLDRSENYLGLPEFYQKKRNYFLELMKHSAFKFIPSTGTYFQLMAYDAISDKSDLEFSSWLVQELKVASIPLSPFYSKGSDAKIVRFCFAKKEETLQQAAEKLCAI